MTTRPLAGRTQLLKRRLRSLLFSPKHARHEIEVLRRLIGDLGPIAVFGGVLRDLSSMTPSQFRSDIDLVIATDDKASLHYHLSGLGAEQNRYGGYRIRYATRTVDVWPLKETWAFRNGYVADPSFERLTRTTFFNWDAIVFSLETEELWHSEHYFQELDGRLLEINLEPNDNPIGNVFRTLRYLLDGASLGPRLAKYLLQFALTTQALHHADRLSSAGYFIPSSFAVMLVSRLEAHIKSLPDRPFKLSSDSLRDLATVKWRP